MKTSSCLTLLLSTAILSLSGCKAFLDPTFMPSGYENYKNEYKTPPAEKADALTYQYTNAVEDSQDAWNEWKAIASDIVHQLAESGYLSDGDIFLSSPGHDYEVLTLLDHALREEFRINGYYLESVPTADSAKIGIVLHKGLPPVMMQSEDTMQNGQVLPNDDLYITVKGQINGQSETLIDVPYELPVYGKAHHESVVEKIGDDVVDAVNGMKGY